MASAGLSVADQRRRIGEGDDWGTESRPASDADHKAWVAQMRRADRAAADSYGGLDQPAPSSPSGPTRASAPAGGTSSAAKTGPTVTIANQGAGFALGLLGYCVAAAYLRYGWSGVTSWVAAKFWNAPSLGQGAATPPTSAATLKLGDPGYVPGQTGQGSDAISAPQITPATQKLISGQNWTQIGALGNAYQAASSTVSSGVVA